VPSTGLEPVPNGLKIRCSATRATTAEVGAEGIEPSNGGLRIRCPAIRRRTRSAGSRIPMRAGVSFLAATIRLSKIANSWGRAESNRPGRKDARVTAGPVSIAVYDPKAASSGRPRTRRPHIARTRSPLFEIEFLDIETSVSTHVEPSSGVAPDPAPYESAALLLSYEGKRGPPRNRTSPRPFWRRSDAQHPRPKYRRSPHLCVFRAMLVRTSPRSPSLSAFGRLGLTSSLKTKKAGNLSGARPLESPFRDLF
jgi:hypothetical protein